MPANRILTQKITPKSRTHPVLSLIRTFLITTPSLIPIYLAVETQRPTPSFHDEARQVSRWYTERMIQTDPLFRELGGAFDPDEREGSQLGNGPG